MCTFSPNAKANYKNVLADAVAKGLNKIQLWVNINGGTWQAPGNCVAEPPNPGDQPFKYYPPGSPGFPAPANAPPDKIGYWNLDERNDAFFSNLQTVVEFATSRGLFVEVTFFAPWIGVWELSPWNPQHGRLSSDPSHTTQVGFTDRGYFVQPDTSNGGNNSNEGLRIYQKNVIDWTIDALDAPPSTVNGGLPFDRVYFEIANEPENGAPATACGFPTPIQALAGAVTAWQQTMIAEAIAYEANTYVTPNGNLAGGHLIAVQPFTTAGAAPYLQKGSSVSVVNGHYTTVSQRVEGNGQSGSALGAIVLARTYASQANVVIASNEGKISGDTTAFPWGGQGETCGWDAATRTTSPPGPPGVDCFGEADSARAEAWEFMLDLGGAFDHFGYFWNSDFGTAVRLELGVLQRFLAALPLRQLVTSPDPPPPNDTGPAWVSIGRSPYANPAKNPSKYWAALQPASTATSLNYVLYIHNSTERKGPQGAFLSFGGYQPIFNASPSSPKYSENFSLCLGTQSQHYLVQWIDPASGRVLSSNTIPGNSSCGTRTTSPTYSYDIALKITQVP